MQIHELTKRRKTNEGILDGLKAAVSAAKTGYDAGKASGKSTGSALAQGAKTFGRAATSPAFGAQADKDAAAKSANAKYDALKKKYGWSDKGDAPAGQAQSATTAPQQSPEQVKQQVQTMVQQFTQEPEFVDLTAVLPDQGKVLKVEIPNKGGTPAEYFKDESGVWKNANGQPVKQSRQLEAMIDADQYSQVSPPAWGQPQPQQGQQKQQGKGGVQKVQQAANAAAATAPAQAAPAQAAPAAAPAQAAQQNESLAEAVGNKKVQSIVANIIKKNRAAAAAAEKATANPKAAPKIEKAKQQVLAAAAAPASKAPNRRAKTNMVKQAFTNYATQLVQAGATAPAGDQAQPGQEQAGAEQASQANPVQKQMAAKTVTTKAGVDGNKLATSIATDPQVKQAVTTMTKESRKPLTQRLEEAIQMLQEDQVRITKDIRIRTAKGDYVKRASDQTWYDPNGVPIDPVKYADYVAKLDKTPQAQTQYQADAQKAAKGQSQGGTDTGAQRAAQQPPQQPPPPPQAPAAAPAPEPDPIAQMAHQQAMQNFLRTRNVDSLNAQIKDTTQQLRNAQIFGTGQTEYLQQQLAQLIAMKV